MIDIVIGLLTGVGVVGMIGMNSRRIGKLDDRIDDVPKTYLTKEDFNRFDDRLFKKLESIEQDIKDASK